MAIFVNQAEITDAGIGHEMQYHPAQSRVAACSAGNSRILARTTWNLPEKTASMHVVGKLLLIVNLFV